MLGDPNCRLPIDEIGPCAGWTTRPRSAADFAGGLGCTPGEPRRLTSVNPDPAAADVHPFGRDVLRRVERQPHDHSGDVSTSVRRPIGSASCVRSGTRRYRSAPRSRPLPFGDLLHRRIHHPRRDAVHPHPERRRAPPPPVSPRPPPPCSPRTPDNSAAPCATRRRHVDDPAGTALLHVPSRRRADQRHGLQVQRQRAIPTGLGHVQERLADAPPSVVNHDVQTARASRASVTASSAAPGAVRSSTSGDTRPTPPPPPFFPPPAIDIQRRHRAPARRQRQSHARPNPPPAPVTRALLITVRSHFSPPGGTGWRAGFSMR